MLAKNPIGWFEIRVEDFERAKKFYEELFGWEFSVSQSSNSIYWNIHTGDNSIGGGFNKKDLKNDGGGQSVILYIEDDNIEKTLEKVQKLGGKIATSKTLISERAGYFALFRDLDNNLMGLWSKK